MESMGHSKIMENPSIQNHCQFQDWFPPIGLECWSHSQLSNQPMFFRRTSSIYWQKIRKLVDPNICPMFSMAFPMLQQFQQFSPTWSNIHHFHPGNWWVVSSKFHEMFTWSNPHCVTFCKYPWPMKFTTSNLRYIQPSQITFTHIQATLKPHWSHIHPHITPTFTILNPYESPLNRMTSMISEACPAPSDHLRSAQEHGGNSIWYDLIWCHTGFMWIFWYGLMWVTAGWYGLIWW